MKAKFPECCMCLHEGEEVCEKCVFASHWESVEEEKPEDYEDDDYLFFPTEEEIKENKDWD